MALKPDQTPSSPMAPAERVDAELLLRMSRASDSPAEARAAWEEFYCRHVEYLHAVCLRALGPLVGGPSGVADLVAEAFRRAYEHAGAFSAGELADPVRQRLRVRAWLGRIAQRLAQSALRRQPGRAVRHLSPEQWQQVAKPASQANGSADAERIELVRRAMATLSAREQLVIRVTFQWYVPEAPHQRLSNEVAAELAETLQTTPENLRQIRRRAMAKLQAYLEPQLGMQAQQRSKP